MNSVVSTHQVRLETVDEASDGQRLDNFLSKTCKGVPKSHLYQLIRSGQVRVNKGRAQADTRLALGDAVRIPPIRTRDKPPAADSPMRQRSLADLGGQLPVVYEDEALVVIDKPQGTAAHGGSGVSSGVIERLRAARPDARFLELAHRLDRDTSGLLILAKTRPALRRLHDLLRSHRVHKRYMAISLGQVPKRQKTIRLALTRIERAGGDRAVVVDPAGKPAVSEIIGLGAHELRSVGLLSLVGIRLETGRTHQIRVHLAANDFPVLGDPRYGKFDINRRAAQQGFSRMFLHARDLAFAHPITGHRVELRSAWPASFAALFEEPPDRFYSGPEISEESGE